MQSRQFAGTLGFIILLTGIGQARAETPDTSERMVTRVHPAGEFMRLICSQSGSDVANPELVEVTVTSFVAPGTWSPSDFGTPRKAYLLPCGDFLIVRHREEVQQEVAAFLDQFRQAHAQARSDADAQPVQTRSGPVADRLVPVPHVDPCRQAGAAKQRAAEVIGIDFDFETHRTHAPSQPPPNPAAPSEAAQQETVAQPLQTRTYAVADLVVPRPQSPKLTDEGVVAADCPAPDFEALEQLITANVVPASWEGQGGGGTIRNFETTLSLVVRQTPGVHKQIAGLLHTLREADRVQIVLEPRFLTVSGKVWQELASDLAGADPGDGLELDGEESKYLVRLAQNDPRSNLLAVPKITLFNGQTSTILLSPQPEDRFVLHATASEDRRTVRLKFASASRQATEVLASARTLQVADGSTALFDLGPCPVRGSNAVNPLLKRIPHAERLLKNDPGRRLVLITARVIVAEEDEVRSLEPPSGAGG